MQIMLYMPKSLDARSRAGKKGNDKCIRHQRNAEIGVDTFSFF